MTRQRTVRVISAAAALAVVAACGHGPAQPSTVVTTLSATRFLAFGDSMTAGKVASGVIDASISYPTQLLSMLQHQYATQAFMMTNDGLNNETAADYGLGGGVTRLDPELVRYQPEVLLLLEGANDLNAGGAANIPTAIQALQTMIRTARARNVRVVIATLPPQIAQPPGAIVRSNSAALVAPFNAQLIQMASSEQTPVVDLYTGMLPRVTDWIDTDGLHPNAAGYQQMAGLFLTTVSSTFVNRFN